MSHNPSFPTVPTMNDCIQRLHSIGPASEDIICTICQTDLEDDGSQEASDAIVQTTCLHFYYRSSLLGWNSGTHELRNTCPECRNVLFTLNAFSETQNAAHEADVEAYNRWLLEKDLPMTPEEERQWVQEHYGGMPMNVFERYGDAPLFRFLNYQDELGDDFPYILIIDKVDTDFTTEPTRQIPDERHQFVHLVLANVLVEAVEYQGLQETPQDRILCALNHEPANRPDHYSDVLQRDAPEKVLVDVIGIILKQEELRNVSGQPRLDPHIGMQQEVALQTPTAGISVDSLPSEIEPSNISESIRRWRNMIFTYCTIVAEAPDIHHVRAADATFQAFNEHLHLVVTVSKAQNYVLIENYAIFYRIGT